MEYSQIVIFMMEIIGTIAFATSGAMLAIQRRMDLFGVIVLGVVTSVGGGMIRDGILGNVPSALLDPIYTAAAAATSFLLFVIIWIRRNLLTSPYRLMYDRVMLLMDAIGLGIFTVVGITVGIHNGYQDETFLLVFLGTLTGVGGGLLRDMMAQVQPYILVKHIYACASIAGGVIYVYLYRYVGELPALVIAPLVVISIRILAAHYHWNLPKLQTDLEDE